MLKKKCCNIFNLIAMKWVGGKVKTTSLDGFWWVESS
jgi:hypothetical protein